MLIPLLKKSGKYSLIDSENFAYRGCNDYEYLDFFKEGYARAKINSKWQYINTDEGFLKLESNYHEIQQFDNGIAAVQIDDIWRFINKSGVVVTKAGYLNSFTKKKGFIEINTIAGYGEDRDGNLFISKFYTGLIDNTGFEVVPPSEECYIDVEDDFILIFTKNAYKAIDFNGNKMFYTQDYTYISSFYGNTAISESKSEIRIIDKKLTKIKSLGKIDDIEMGTFYTVDGRITKGFINGLCILKSKDKWGFINLDGEFVCDCEYDFLSPFICNCAIAGKIFDGKMKFALLNKNFQNITPYKYDTINPFSEGYATVELNGKWGVIYEGGNEIIEPTFDQVGDCINGFIWVSVGDYDYKNNYFGKFGFYNNKGEKICPLIYDGARDFDSCLTAVVEQKGKFGLVNEKGCQVAETRYDHILDNFSDFYFVEESNKRFVINNKGQEFIEDKVEEMILEEALTTWSKTFSKKG